MCAGGSGKFLTTEVNIVIVYLFFSGVGKREHAMILVCYIPGRHIFLLVLVLVG